MGRRRKVYFIQMDNSHDAIKLDRGLYNWLSERKLEVSLPETTAGGLGAMQTIYECDGNRAGIVLTVEYTEADGR